MLQVPGGPRDTRNRQELFRENGDEWGEEEEYEESQQMFNSAFRSVLKTNQSINTKGFYAQSQMAGGQIDGVIQEYNRRQQQQSLVVNKENTKLPKMS